MTGSPGAPRSAVHKDGIRLRRLNRQQVQDLRDDLADLYVAAAPATGCRDRRDFLSRLDDDVRRPGFALLLAETTTMVGCVFGAPVGRGDLWWRGVDPGRRHTVARLTAEGRVVALTQVVADPHGQSRAVAERLQERLLSVRHAALGLTLVDPADRAARSALRSWGWQDIGNVARHPGPVTLRALVLPRDPGPEPPYEPPPDHAPLTADRDG